MYNDQYDYKKRFKSDIEKNQIELSNFPSFVPNDNIESSTMDDSPTELIGPINDQDNLYCNEILERPNIIKLSEEYWNYTVNNGHLINFEANK